MKEFAYTIRGYFPNDAGDECEWTTFVCKGCLDSGMVDKNGIAIFDGDRVKFGDNDDTGIVVFHNAMFIIKHDNSDCITVLGDMPKDELNFVNVEVIGHISECETPYESLPIYSAVTLEKGVFKVKEKPLNEAASEQPEIVRDIGREHQALTQHEQYLKENYRYAQDVLNFVIEDRSKVEDLVDGYLRELYEDWITPAVSKTRKMNNDSTDPS